MDDQKTISSQDPGQNPLKEDPEQGTVHGESSKEDLTVADPGNPQNWTKAKKWGNFSISFINAFSGYFASSIYMPAVHDLIDYFNTNLTVMNATIALYVLAMAIAPLFWAPLSQRIGRRPVYIASMVVFTVATIICGIANNIGLFFVFRIFQGAASSAGMTVGGGSVADMFPPHQRGRAMSLLTLGTVIGPAFSPLMGGYVAQYLGWRWIFYICTMIGGVILAANVFILRETLYRPQTTEQVKSTTLKERIALLKFDPFSGLLLLLRPEVFMMTIPMAVSFGWFYYLVIEISPTYLELYHFSQGSLGLLYLTGGLGNCCGAIAAGIVADKFYIYLRSKAADGVVAPEKRLTPVLAGIPLIIAGSLIHGWLLHAKVHWFAPLVGYFIMALGTMFTMVISTNYLVESYLPVAASMIASVSFVRNLVAMLFTLVAASVRTGLGDGWAFTLSALMSLFFFSICVPYVRIYGERLRKAEPWWSTKN